MMTTRPSIIFFSHTDGEAGTALDDNRLRQLAGPNAVIRNRNDALNAVNALARKAAEPLQDAFEDLHDDRQVRVNICYSPKEFWTLVKNARQDSTVVLHSNLHSTQESLDAIIASLREARPDLFVVVLPKLHEFRTYQNPLVDRIMDAGNAEKVVGDIVKAAATHQGKHDGILITSSLPAQSPENTI